MHRRYRFAAARRLRDGDLRAVEAVDLVDLRADLVAFRGDVRFAADVRCGASATAASVGLFWPSDRCLSWRKTMAVPPTPKRIGHSTKPVAPIAAIASAAAGVEWLPLLTPFLMPVTAPCTPPITPLTAAPPTAPAAARVASADCVTTRAAPWIKFTVLPNRYRVHLPEASRQDSGYPSLSEPIGSWRLPLKLLRRCEFAVRGLAQTHCTLFDQLTNIVYRSLPGVLPINAGGYGIRRKNPRCSEEAGSPFSCCHMRCGRNRGRPGDGRGSPRRSVRGSTFVGICVPVSEQPSPPTQNTFGDVVVAPALILQGGSALGQAKAGCDEQRAPERTKAISMCLPCD